MLIFQVDIFTIAIIAVWKEDECCIKFTYVVFVSYSLL